MKNAAEYQTVIPAQSGIQCLFRYLKSLKAANGTLCKLKDLALLHFLMKARIQFF